MDSNRQATTVPQVAQKPRAAQSELLNHLGSDDPVQLIVSHITP